MFFNGNTMVRTGHYNGVPLYADATLEPYSIVYVPIGRGLMQPYERPRRGDLAGTTGSRPPSFPVQLDDDGTSRRRPQWRRRHRRADRRDGVFTPEAGQSERDPAPRHCGGVAARGARRGGRRVLPTARSAVVTLRRPESNDGIWVRFRRREVGERRRAGPVRPRRRSRTSATTATFPVFARRS